MNRPLPNDRPTPQELIAGNKGDPWACRSCGCKRWKVVDSRQYGIEPRKRERICGNCGEPLPTQEVPVPPGYKLVVVPEEDEESVIPTGSVSKNRPLTSHTRSA